MKHDANANIRSDANYYVQPGVNRNDGERGASNCYERSQHHDQVYQRGVSNRYGRSQHPDQVYQRDINHDINPSCYENNNATSYIDEKHNFMQIIILQSIVIITLYMIMIHYFASVQNVENLIIKTPTNVEQKIVFVIKRTIKKRQIFALTMIFFLDDLFLSAFFCY
jgi:hypothetical protein